MPKSNTPPNDLPKLSAPAHRALAAAKITRLRDLNKISEKELGKLHGIGPNAIVELRSALAAKGWSFAADKKKRAEKNNTQKNSAGQNEQGKTNMSGDSNAPASPPPPLRNPALAELDKFVGTWKIFGDAQGHATCAWLEGGFFLERRGELDFYGRKIIWTELIGYEQNLDSVEPRQECTSHTFDNTGRHYEYVWQVGADTFTIWTGHRGSDDHFNGKIMDNGNTMTGRWEWPGGGYGITMTRVEHAKFKRQE